ncbi:MAG: lysophospholipid acyltransferase family protein [Candidatus Theseobacter exili]|nr:lysophospholipid acyltransferase family protein [Candidatus Theseobacter exili]
MFQYLFYRTLQRFSETLGSEKSLWLAEKLGDISFMLDRSRRKNILSNANVILGTKADLKSKEHLGRNVFRNFWKYIVDFICLTDYYLENIDSLVTFTGLEHLDKCLAQGRGVIILSAHIGNWELAGMLLAAKGYPLNTVYLPHKDVRVNQLFLDIRGKTGMKSMPVEIAVHGCQDVLKRGEVLALLGDLLLGDKGQETVFFDKKVKLPKGPAILALRTDSFLMPAYCVRKPEGGFLFCFEEPFLANSVNENGTNDWSYSFTNCVMSIEGIIRSFPDQWIVFNNIWRDSL